MLNENISPSSDIFSSIQTPSKSYDNPIAQHREQKRVLEKMVKQRLAFLEELADEEKRLIGSLSKLKENVGVTEQKVNIVD